VTATAKLMLLEERFLDPDFRILASTPAPDLKELLRQWEAWGQQRDGATKPQGVSEGSRPWAASAPALAESEEDIGAYLTLAAVLTASASGGPLSGRVSRFVDQLIADKDIDTARSIHIGDELSQFDDAEVEQIITAIAGRVDRIQPPSSTVRLILAIAEARSSVAGVVCKILDERLHGVIDVSVAAVLALSPVLQVRTLAGKLSQDRRLTAPTRKALASALPGKR
jgi:hypothetical protein